MRSGPRTARVWRALAVTAAFVTVLAVQAAPASSAALTFAPASLYTAHSYASGVAIGDLNGDGKADLATANASSHNDASVLLGTGSGTFGSATNYAVSGGGPGVAIGDLNGDGKPDLVTANNLSHDISVLLGDGLGSFGTATTFGVGGADPYPISVAIGDLNGDGKPDLAVANNCSGPGNVSVLLGDGTGSFAFAATYDAADSTSSPSNCATSVAIGDLNGDGKPDLAVSDDDLRDGAPADAGGVSVLLGTGHGSFGPVTHYHTDSYSWSVAIGDLNGDGKLDLAVANYGSPPSGDVSVLLGDGSGSFGSATNYDAGAYPQSVAIGDLDGDRKPDLAVANFGGRDVSVLLGTGSGSFASATHYSVDDGTHPYSGFDPWAVTIGDLNGDGRLDLAVGDDDGEGFVTVLLNTTSAIQNTVAPSISGTAQDGKLLTASRGTWSSPDPPTYTYQWQRCDSSGGNCQNIAAATRATYRATSADVGSTLTVAVTATDNGQSAQAAAAPTGVVASPPPPFNTVTPSIAGTPQDGTQLAASRGTWSSPDPLTYTYQWQRCDSSGGNCQNIAAATSAGYRAKNTDVGSKLTVVVTVTDKESQSAQATALPTGVVASPPPPSNTVAPSIAGTAQDGQLLTAARGTWSSPDALTYTYQWQRCDSSGGNCHTIATATKATYRATSADIGSKLTIVVTATDKESQGAQATAAATGVVASPPPPSNTVAPSISGTAQNGQLLTAAHGTWSSPDPLAYTYQWQRCDSSGGNCHNIATATKATYRATSADVGSKLTVVVTATDKESQSGHATAGSVGPVS